MEFLREFIKAGYLKAIGKMEETTASTEDKSEE